MDQQTLDRLSPEKINDNTPEELKEIFGGLQKEDFEQLSKAYPNRPQGNNYLILVNTQKGVTQVYPTSTWYNLWVNISKLGQPYWRPFTTKKMFKAGNTPVKQKVAAIQDLTNTDLNNATGLKKVAQAQTATGKAEGDENTDLNNANANENDSNSNTNAGDAVDYTKMKAVDKIALIDEAGDAARVDEILSGDLRQTVVDAATKKKASFNL